MIPCGVNLPKIPVGSWEPSQDGDVNGPLGMEDSHLYDLKNHQTSPQQYGAMKLQSLVHSSHRYAMAAVHII